MEAERTRWSDERLDDLKESVDGVRRTVERLDGRVDGLQHAMVIGFISLGTMMFGGFAALITLLALFH